jgi:hypothetical protein
MKTVRVFMGIWLIMVFLEPAFRNPGSILSAQAADSSATAEEEAGTSRILTESVDPCAEPGPNSPSMPFEELAGILTNTADDSFYVYFRDHRDSLLTNATVYFDTLVQCYRDRPEDGRRYRFLMIASGSKRTGEMRTIAGIIDSIQQSEYLKHRLDVNNCSANIERTIQDRIRACPDSAYIASALTLGSPGFYGVMGFYRELREKFIVERDAEQSKALVGGLLLSAASIAITAPLLSDATTFRAISIHPDFFGSASDGLQDRYIRFFTPVLYGASVIQDPKMIRLIKQQLVHPGNDGDKTLKSCLCKGWANIGAGAFPSVIEAVSDPRMREYAIETLSVFHDTLAVPLIVESLKNKDSRVVTACLQSLDRMNAEVPADQFNALLNNKDKEVRNTARKFIEKREPKR